MPDMPPWLRLTELELSIAVHVQPGARRTAIVGLHGERLKVAVQARATDGHANAALIKVIAEALKQPPSSLRIASGIASRDKRVAAPRGSMGADEILRCLWPK
ncbi:MAG TPA: DUF167 domain-containing protein [Burkholderiaceae bacterium]|nr:DUF167 domain-containing protein [Burkholderiaceae bacterium]